MDATTPASSTFTGQRERFVFVVGGTERGVDEAAPRPRWCGYEPPPESKKDRLHEVAVHFTDYYRRFDDLDTRTGISWTPGELPDTLAGPFVLNIQFAASLDSGPRAFSTTLRRADGTTTTGDGHIRVSLCRFERFTVTATTAGDDTYAAKTTRLAFVVGGNANGVDATAPRPDWCGVNPPPPEPPGPTTPEPEPGAFGTPGGLRVASTGTDYIEWSWEPVEDATSYTLQIDVTTPYTFTPPSATHDTTDTSLRVSLRSEVVAYGRVRANAGTRAAPIRSEFSEPVSGTSGAAGLVLGVPEPEVSATGLTFIEWTWGRVPNAIWYRFAVAATVDDLEDATVGATTARSWREEVEPGTTRYIRVQAVTGTQKAPIISEEWSAPVSGVSDPMQVPTPSVSERGRTFIEWTWGWVRGNHYEVQVGPAVDDLEYPSYQQGGARYLETDLEPGTTRYIRVRAKRGLRGPGQFVGEWSAPVSGTTDRTVPPLVVRMTPPNAAADSECGGRAFCGREGVSSLYMNPRMTIDLSHTADIWTMDLSRTADTYFWGGGSSGHAKLSAGKITVSSIELGGVPILPRMLEAHGATLKFRRTYRGIPTGEDLYITCSISRCSAAASSPPARPR